MSEIKYLSVLEKMAEAVPAASHRGLRARLAACVVYKRDIVSFGINQLKSHPFQAKFSKNEDSIFLHAETDAIKNALSFGDVVMFDLKSATGLPVYGSNIVTAQ